MSVSISLPIAMNPPPHSYDVIACDCQYIAAYSYSPSCLTPFTTDYWTVYTNASSMLKCSGCNCTYYCSKECQKKGWKYHKSTCKNLKIDGGFDRDTLTNLKYAINLNINRSCLKTLLYVLLDVNTEKLILTLMIKMIHI